MIIGSDVTKKIMKQGITIPEFCKAADIHYTTGALWLRKPNTRLNSKTAAKVRQYFSAPIVKPEAPTISGEFETVTAVITAFKTLTPEAQAFVKTWI